jgi:hypothetical protein
MMRNLLWWVARGMVVVALIPLLLGAAFFRAGDRLESGALPGTARGTGLVERDPRIDSVAAVALRGAPFRQDGRPSRTVYDPNRPAEFQVNEGPARPALVLSGILEGGPPLAVIEGVPGRDGAVVMAEGDTAGGLRIRRIKEGRVTVTGMDTTWSLTVRGTP